MIFKELLEKKDIQQRRLAKIINVSDSIISRYKSGERTPTLENMKKLADALEVDLQVIVNCFVKNEKENSKNEKSI